METKEIKEIIKSDAQPLLIGVRNEIKTTNQKLESIISTIKNHGKNRDKKNN